MKSIHSVVCRTFDNNNDTTTMTMTGDTTNRFDGLYSYEHPLDKYDNDNICSGEESGGGGVVR